MADFAYIPNEADESAKFNINRIAFGDGYIQRTPKGINNGLRVWDVSFSDRSLTEADAIVNFFRTKAGSLSFTWRPQGFTADVKVVCPQYTRPLKNRFINGAFVYDVRAQFEESPL